MTSQGAAAAVPFFVVDPAAAMVGWWRVGRTYHAFPREVLTAYSYTTLSWSEVKFNIFF